MQPLLADAAARAARYLETLPQRSVAAAPQALAALAAFDEALPARGRDPAQVLAQLDALGSPATCASAGGRFFGFVIGGALPASLAAHWLATAWDQNAASPTAAPSACALEQVALRWLLEVFGLPPNTAGAFVTGATLANFTALAAARHAVLARAGWDVEADGLAGAPPVTVLVGAEAHPSVGKALGLLGFGRRQRLVLPCDAQGRVRALPELPPGPAILCLQAGNVNTGASDDFAPLLAAARAHEGGCWVHVDGAFGLWALAAPALRAQVEAALGADSFATDAHKWPGVPYDSGIALVKDEAALRAAMAVSAAYLPAARDGWRVPSDHTPELSRRARGVDLWAALASLGREGVAALVERCCAHARRFAEGLRAAGHEVLNEVVLNQVLVAFGDAATTRATVAALQAEGTCWCGITEWQGRTAMRISVSGWATDEADVEAGLAAMLRVAQAVREPRGRGR